MQNNLHNDVIDWDMDELDEEPDEPHHGKPDCRGRGNTLKLCGNNHLLTLSLSLSLSPKTPYLSCQAWCSVSRVSLSLLQSPSEALHTAVSGPWPATERRTIDSAKQNHAFLW